MEQHEHDHEEDWDRVGAVLVGLVIILGLMVVGRLIFQAVTGH